MDKSFTQPPTLLFLFSTLSWQTHQKPNLALPIVVFAWAGMVARAEPFPTLIVAIIVTIAVVGAIVIVYFTKFKK